MPLNLESVRIPLIPYSDESLPAVELHGLHARDVVVSGHVKKNIRANGRIEIERLRQLLRAF